MQTVGIVALSILCGLFLALLIAGLIIAIWSALRVKKSADSLSANLEKVHAETVDMLAEHRSGIQALTESARSNFTSIRDEMRKTLSMFEIEFRKMLDTNERSMSAAVSKINAEDMAKAAQQGLAACIRLERVTAALDNILMEREDSGQVEEPGDTSYAPKGSTIYDITPTGQGDREAIAEENADTTRHA